MSNVWLYRGCFYLPWEYNAIIIGFLSLELRVIPGKNCYFIFILASIVYYEFVTILRACLYQLELALSSGWCVYMRNFCLG